MIVVVLKAKLDVFFWWESQFYFPPITSERLNFFHKWSFNNFFVSFFCCFSRLLGNWLRYCFKLHKTFYWSSIKGTISGKMWKGEKWNKHEKRKRKTTINNTKSQTKSSPLMLVRWRKNILNSHVNSFGISFFDCFFPNWSIVYAVLVNIVKMFTDFLWSKLVFENYSTKFSVSASRFLHAILCPLSKKTRSE